MAACPNKNTKEWKDLVDSLQGNDGKALAAFVINDYEIPTPAEAKEMLAAAEEREASGNIKTEEQQEKKEKKLARVREQIATLTRIEKSLGSNDIRRGTIQKLKQNLKQYEEMLEKDESSVSVSNLFGGGETEDMRKFQDYAEFGIFEHFVVETLQKEALDNNRSLTSLLTKDRLKKLIKEYEATFNKDFTIKGLIERGEITNEEELYNMTIEVLSVLQSYVSMGYTILPEISVVGKDRNGRNIVGRLDMLAIGKNGSVVILDLKSKKMKSSTTVDSLAYSWPVNSSRFTDTEFASGSRSAYENWDVQLGIYARLLEQSDISTEEKRIIALQYFGSYSTASGKQFTDEGVDTFEYVFYKVRTYTSAEEDKASEQDAVRYRTNMKKIRKVLPTEVVEDEPVIEKSAMKNIFNLSDEQAEKLIKDIEVIVEREIKNVITKLKEARDKGDERTVKFYEERRESLRKIQDVLTKKKEGKDGWDAPYKLGIIIQSLQVDSENLLAEAQRINNVIITEDLRSVEDQLAKQGKALDKLHAQSTGFNLILNQLNRLVLDTGISNTSLGMRTLADIENRIRGVKAVYNKFGFRNMVTMMSTSLADFQITRINEQRKERLLPRLEFLKRERDNLLKGNQSSSIWYRMSKPMSNILRSATGQEIKAETELRNIEIQIEKLELEMQGISLEESDIEKFIEGILDPASPVYIGQGTSFFTPLIASTSSADWVLSSFAGQLKVAMTNGRQRYVNYVESEGLEKELAEYRRGNRDTKSLNEPISEVRYFLQFDEDGNESKVQRRSFVTPWKQDYYDTIDRHANAMRQINKKLRNETNPEKRKQLNDQKALLAKTHLEWRLANTEMRYVQQYYELDKLLPEEYKIRRDELYQEKNDLENSAGFNNAELLDESTLERIAEIEVEISKLKKEFSDKEDGGYARYIALQDEFFTYEVNQNYFDRLYNQKKLELTDANGNVNTEALAKWKAQNTVRVPREEWYEAVSQIWDQIYEIIGQPNSAIQGLKEKHKEILRQYRRKGAVDVRFISEEDAQVLEELEDLIQTYKLASPATGLSFEDRQTLNDLFKALDTLQTKVENPFYVQEFNERLEDLDIAWNAYQAAEQNAEKDRLLEQFLLKEMEFKTWYDRNHTNKYKSRLVSNEGLAPLPKPYNSITVPSDEAMMREVPDYKFSRRIPKREAYNLNYQEDAMGYPVPKGVAIDSAEVIGNSQWVNPKYDQIRNDPRTSKFYHSFVGRFLDMQTNTLGRKLGYTFPGYEERSLEDIRDKGVLEGAKNQARIFADKNLTVGSDYDFSINGYASRQDERIQFKHNVPLPVEQQSIDGISSVIKWLEQAHVNMAMGNAQVMSSSMIGYMEQLYEQLSDARFEGVEVRKEKLQKVIDQMKFEHDKFIKGEWKKDEGLAARAGDLMLRGFSLVRMGLDLPNQVGNMLSGNVQAFLGSHKSGLYSGINLRYAKGKIYGKDGLIGNFMRDTDKIGNKSFSTKMFMYWNPLGDTLDYYYDRSRSLGDRLKQGLMDGNFAMYIQDKGEIEIGSTIWYAIMDNVKVKLVKTRDENGKPVEYQTDNNGNIKTVNVYDAYTENEKGEIVIRPDVDWNITNQRAVQKMVWSEIRRTQGRYAEMDRAKIEQGIWGRMLVFFRKYLEPAITNRFGRGQTNWEGADEALGFYRGIYQAYRYYTYREFLSGLFGGKGMNEFYQRKSQMAAREVALGTAMYILGRMILAAIPDDDEDDMTFGTAALYSLVAVYAKVDMETRSLIPLIVVGGIDNYFENLSSFTNAGRDLVRMKDLLEHGFYLGLSPFTDAEWVQKGAFYQRRTKLFDKGEAKIKKDIMNITGYMNIYELFNPQERIKNYKSRMN